MERFQHALVGRASSTVHLVETSGFVADSSRSYAKMSCWLNRLDLISPVAASLGNPLRAGNDIQILQPPLSSSHRPPSPGILHEEAA